jgi:nocardicin N-oxygenase
LLSTLRPYAKPGGAIDRLSTGHADDDTVGLAIFMLIAGAETITGTIAAALDILARNPGWQDQLRAEPALMPGFVRETLRLAGPLRRLTPRFAVEDVSIGGAEIRRDDLVILRTDSAHRDPAVYTDPERIDPTRKGAALLAFGGGAHICQGPLIGAAEAEVMVAAVLARFAVRPGSTRGALFAHEDWRVFETLPLTLTPVTAPDGETDR